MRSLISATLLTVVTARYANLKDLEYGFCDGAGQPFSIEEFGVEPYPVEVQMGLSST